MTETSESPTPQTPVIPAAEPLPAVPYAVPTIDEELSAEGATELLDEIMASAAADPKHPYTNNQHFHHQKYQAAVTRLFEIKSSADADAGLGKVGKAIKQAMAEKTEKQNTLVAEAKAEMEALEKLGFDHTEVPDDIRDYQVRGLTEQRLHAEGKYEQLLPMLVKDAAALGDDTGMRLLRDFQGSKIFDKEFIASQLENVIVKIAQLNKKKLGIG